MQEETFLRKHKPLPADPSLRIVRPSWQQDGGTPGVVGIPRSHCRRQRDTDRDPAVYENFEWLAGVMKEMDRREGSDRSFEGMSTAAALDERIASIRERLQIERSLRTVIVASPEVVLTRQQRPRRPRADRRGTRDGSAFLVFPGAGTVPHAWSGALRRVRPGVGLGAGVGLVAG